MQQRNENGIKVVFDLKRGMCNIIPNYKQEQELIR